MSSHRLKLLATILLPILSSLLLFPSATIAAPDKSPLQDSGSKKSLNTVPAADPAKTGESTRNVVRPLNAASPLAAEPDKAIQSAPVKIDEKAVGQTDKKADKILATINGSNITQSDFDRYLFQRGFNPNSGNLTNDIIDVVFDGLFNEILTRDYLAKLGRLNDPLLLQRIEGLRYQAIGEFFKFAVASNQKPITEAEIQKFIDEHPDYYRDRRYYYFTLIELVKNPDLDVSQLRSMLNTSDNFDKIILLLNSKRITYSVFRGFKASEMIYETVFAKLKTMAPGESAIIPEPDTNRIFIAKLFSSSADPIDANKKRDETRLAIAMSRVDELTLQTLKQLHESADIKFIDKPKANINAAPGRFSANNARVGTKPAGFFQKYDRRGRLQADSSDFGSDLITKENGNSKLTGSKFVMSLLINIWLLSLFVIVPATFYNFIKTSNVMYGNLVLNNAQGMYRGSLTSHKLEKILLDPVISWITGIALTLLIAYIARDAFYEKNLDTLFLSNKNIIISVSSALLASAVIIYITSLIYPRFPGYLKNSRLLFFVAILISNILILKVL